MNRKRSRIQFPDGFNATTGFFLLTIATLLPAIIGDTLVAQVLPGHITNGGLSPSKQQLETTPSATESTTPTEIPTQTGTSAPTESGTATILAVNTWTPTSTNTPTHTITQTIVQTSAQSATPSMTMSYTPTRTLTSTQTPVHVPARTILINEIAWAGTDASTSDEWIELFNPSSEIVNLEDWRLAASDGTPDISLAGHIGPGRYFILERSDDNTIADITANLIYTGALGNGGETLILYGPGGEVIDSANSNGGAWPAGDSSTRATMERIGDTPDQPAAWGTNNGASTNGVDQAGNPILGTPKQVNSLVIQSTSTAMSTSTPSATATIGSTRVPELSVIISEIAWAGTLASPNDEWIELYNPGASSIHIDGWTLVSADGSPHIGLAGVIQPGGFFLLERSDDDAVATIPADMIFTGALSNQGETMLLLDPSGELVDSANRTGGPWPAGDVTARLSMERLAGTHDGPGAWLTNNGLYVNGEDQDGNQIQGTPRNPNSIWFQSTPTPTESSPHTATNTPTASITAPQLLYINEIAWSGTLASSNDEWIELHNPAGVPINLGGWRLVSSDGTPDILLQGMVDPGGYFLLERSADDTVLDIPADQIYIGSLRNSGETLFLMNPYNEVVDSANLNGGNWPAGLVPERASMERIPGTRDCDSAWRTNSGYVFNGYAADGSSIRGTPRKANSILWPVPSPTPLPEGVRINEFLPHPKYDWNGDGQINTADEFIELINLSRELVNLYGWMLDDIEGGSGGYILPTVILRPGETRAFFNSETGLSLSDRGDSVRLIAPNGVIVDERSYYYARDVNLSWCRIPDGYGALMYPCWPTPHLMNFHFPHPRDRPMGMPIADDDPENVLVIAFWDSVIYTDPLYVCVCFSHYYGFPFGWLCLL